MITWLLTATALAAGTWHPNDVAAASTRFSAASERLSKPAEALQDQDARAAAAVRAYRLSLDLLGPAAPAADRERLLALEADYFAQHNRAQAFLDQLVGGFDDLFSGAVQTAVKAAGGGEPCEKMIPSGPQLPGIRPRLAPNPACQGEDLNPRIAAAIDADPALGASLDKLLGQPFPAITLESKPMPPVGAGERWIAVDQLFTAGAKEKLRAIDTADDEARVEIEAAVEAGDEQRVLAMKDKAAAIAAATAHTRAELAEPVLAAADKALGKLGGAAWCANPVALGGCTGADATKELAPQLLDDAKVAKALAR
jgi:hypothetical protein